MALTKLKKMIIEDEQTTGEVEFYHAKDVKDVNSSSKGGKMMLLEPRA